MRNNSLFCGLYDYFAVPFRFHTGLKVRPHAAFILPMTKSPYPSDCDRGGQCPLIPDTPRCPFLIPDSY
jgi:hypothetical protein